MKNVNTDYEAKRDGYIKGTTAELANQLFNYQIDAAKKLHQRCSWWRLEEETFHLLQTSMRGFELEATLLKLAVVNGLYNTREYYLDQAAEHMTNILSSLTGSETSNPALFIEQLATFFLPEKTEPRHCWSLASKFAHFFIDADLFPIYDSYVKKMVVFHLYGEFKDIYDSAPNPYNLLFQDFKILRKIVKMECSNIELDRYLWLGGQRYVWRHGNEKIRSEIANLFKNMENNKEIEDELNALEGKSFNSVSTI